QRIIPESSADCVIAVVTSHDGIQSVAAVHGIADGCCVVNPNPVAGDRIIATAAVNRVIPVAAVNGVVAVAAVDPILIASADDRVVAVVAQQCAGPTAIDRIVTSTPIEQDGIAA